MKHELVRVSFRRRRPRDLAIFEYFFWTRLHVADTALAETLRFLKEAIGSDAPMSTFTVEALKRGRFVVSFMDDNVNYEGPRKLRDELIKYLTGL